jgi:Na+/melibiose symporter-like transporter
VGFFIFPFYPIIFELGCEVAYPVGESLPTGFMIGGGNILTFILVFPISPLVGKKQKSDSFEVLIIYEALLIIGALCIFFSKEDLRRSQAEIKHKNQYSAESIETLNENQ